MNKKKIRCWLTYKNFSPDCSISHLGMGITAAYTAKTLIQYGYQAEAMPIMGGDDLIKMLTAQALACDPVTHVVVMAQFIPTNWLAKICRAFPRMKAALNCHSNVGFLQAEPQAILLLREAIDLETGTANFFASGNNKRFVQAMERSYGRPLQFLPNLYYMHGTEPIHRPRWNGGLIRIGAFGSHRIYKNFSTAIDAALILTHDLKTTSEIWINSGRSDGAGSAVYNTALAWTRGVPGVTLKELHWTSWPNFRQWLGSMNLLLQPSYTESFNNITADGVCEGTASVVSDTIDWAPETWQASSDDSVNVANIGRMLLTDPHAVVDGYAALKAYVKDGIPYWETFFNRP